MERLIVRTETKPDHVALRLIGPAGLADAGTLEEAVERLIDKRPMRVLVDLTQLKFVCSMAIGHLLALGQAVKSNGGMCVLGGANGDVGAALERCRIGHLMSIAPTAEEAAAALNA